MPEATHIDQRDPEDRELVRSLSNWFDETVNKFALREDNPGIVARASLRARNAEQYAEALRLIDPFRKFLFRVVESEEGEGTMSADELAEVDRLAAELPSAPIGRVCGRVNQRRSGRVCRPAVE